MALSRLVPRKGIDLLADVVPAMCSRRPDLHFVIGAPALVTLCLHSGLLSAHTTYKNTFAISSADVLNISQAHEKHLHAWAECQGPLGVCTTV